MASKRKLTKSFIALSTISLSILGLVSCKDQKEKNSLIIQPKEVVEPKVEQPSEDKAGDSKEKPADEQSETTKSETTKEEPETKSENQPLVRRINAKYMRKHIWDYKNNTNFVFKGKRPVVIDFYADWCGPCRLLSPKVKKMAKKYKGQIDFYKVNVDNEQELARVFRVTSYPTLKFIPVEGRIITTTENISMGQLEELISKIK